MKLSVEQALRQGVEAHKAGKVQEAERLYREVLHSHSSHPDANHNLGVLVLSMNKVDEALFLFKAAIDANPKVEQYWMSYIGTLVQHNQLKNAKQAFKQAKKQGMTGGKLNALETQLFSAAHTENNGAGSSLQVQINNLLEHYQNGRFGEAEKLAISMTQDFPKEQFGWKVLGAILGQTGRYSEAVKANQMSVTLSPQDAEAHRNLGVALQELGRLDGAAASYKQAIALKPDFAEAHSNLGVTLQKLGRLDEAEASLKQAIVLNPHYAEAHRNLGIVLQELDKLNEAEVSYKQAIKLNPDYAEAHDNLGSALQELDRFDDAEASLKQAIALKPDYAEAHNNLGNLLVLIRRYEEAEAILKQALALKPDYAEAHNNLGVATQELGRLDEAEERFNQALILKPDFNGAMLNLAINKGYIDDLEAEIHILQNLLKKVSGNYTLNLRVCLAICKFLSGNFSDSKKHNMAAAKIHEVKSWNFKAEKAYQKYLSFILEWYEKNDVDVYNPQSDKILYVVGESHSLTSHHLRVQRSGVNFFGKAKLIKGCKQWHLGNPLVNKYKKKFESIFHALPKYSHVLLAIGEIDCRLESGIIEHKKFPDKDVKDIILNTVNKYLDYIENNNSDCQHNIIIQGVPCPNIDTENYEERDVAQLIDVIKNFNNQLKIMAKEKGFEFLDVHQLTDRGDGLSNAQWHIDSTHLSPAGMLEAWRTVLIN